MRLVTRKLIGFLSVFLLLSTGCASSETGGGDSSAKPTAAFTVSSSEAEIGQQVTLDGSQSSDPNGNELSFMWSLQAPGGSSAQLNTTSGSTTTFTPDVVGTYTVELSVNNGTSQSDPTSKMIEAVEGSTSNQAPTADAGSDQTIQLGETATVDGSASSDPDGDQLSFNWSLTNQPSASNVTLSNTNSAQVQFTPDVAGDFVLELDVSDGSASDTDTVTITATDSSDNSAPTAEAGSAQTVSVGSEVTLDGSGSSDPEGDSLSFSWSLTQTPSGSNAQLNNPETTAPTFAADVAGTYIAELTVSDGNLDDTDTVEITATEENENTAPTADAGSGTSVSVGTQVQLDASNSSDAEDSFEDLSFQWAFKQDPSNGSDSIADPSQAQTTFTPSVSGTYTLEVTVTDADGASDTATVDITVNVENQPPSAVVGSTRSVEVGNTVTLDGTNSSDPEDAFDELTFSWRLTQQPSGASDSLTDSNTAEPTLTPSAEGTYTAELTVTDTAGATDTASVDIDAISGNSPPTADAGSDEDTDIGKTVILSALASSDAEDSFSSLSFSWEIITAPSGGGSDTLDDANTALPVLTPSAAGDYILEVTVTDTDGATATDTVTVSVNHPPVADAGSDQTVNVGMTVQLDASGTTDEEDDPSDLTFEWNFTQDPSNGSDSLTDDTAMSPTFTPTVAGTYELELVVVDSNLAEDTDTVTITVNEDLMPSSAGEVIVTEIMQNPSTVEDSDGGEWFEVYNTTSDKLDLDGCTFSDADSESFTVEGTLEVNGTSYATLADSNSPGFTPDYNYDGGMTLANSSDEIILTCDGTEIDRVEWDDGATFPDPSGASMELSENWYGDVGNDDGGNWTTASADYNGDKGTPGSAPVQPNSAPVADAGSDQSVDVGANVTLDATGSSDAEDSYSDLSFSWSFTQDPSNGSDTLNNASTDSTEFTPSVAGTYIVEVTVTDTEGATSTDTVSIEAIGAPNAEGDVIITEIMKDPTSVEDQDGGEWFEVYNTTSATLDLDGCTVSDTGIDSFTIAGDLQVDGDGYLTLADSASPGFTPDYNYSGDMALANNDDEIILTCNGTEIDRVEYDGGSTFPDPTGASMELNDDSYDATSNDDGANWSTATNDYNGDKGTPGN